MTSTKSTATDGTRHKARSRNVRTPSYAKSMADIIGSASDRHDA